MQTESTTDETAFRTAICADPDDDTVRLVYADYLQEHGQESRSEFIRIQIRLARPPWSSTDMIRERQLLELRTGPRRKGPRNEYLWANSVTSLDRSGPIGYKFRRGFIEQITCTAADWLTHGDTIRAQHPVTKVRLTTVPLVAYGFDALLIGDPQHTVLSLGTVERERRDDDQRGDFSFGLPAILRLRWPGISFTLPTGLTNPVTV